MDTCADCRGAENFLSQYDTDALPDAARHIAYGVANGGWACDHVDWTPEDMADAFQALWAVETNRRDHLRAALDLIADHARRDEAERGFGEASRYYGIAENAISKAGLPPRPVTASAPERKDGDPR
jgi:hypothetical protein